MFFLLSEEFDDNSINQWLVIKLKSYHENKFGEECEIRFESEEE